MSLTQLPKTIFILGPTASGKTVWGLDLAKRFNGVIISADSRQVYKKMDIGTAKPKGKWQGKGEKRAYYVNNLPHYLMDFLDPGEIFTAAEFRDSALNIIQTTEQNRLIPFVVGGTGLYISALADNWLIPRVPPNKKLRQSLEEKTHDELIHLLSLLDPRGVSVVDEKNKRRLIRALEVSILSGIPFSKQRVKGERVLDPLMIGIHTPREKLYERIDERIETMIEEGLLNEAKQLLKQKYGWQLPSMNSIGYKQLKKYLAGQMSLEQAIGKLKTDTRHFAKHQLTWFRRYDDIHWCKTIREAETLISNFLSSKKR
ncbi:MAG: tRNA (adenosine(37)-N6)-dimethylallyltransferase MiaA [Patescibacteria group bacterium]